MYFVLAYIEMYTSLYPYMYHLFICSCNATHLKHLMELIRQVSCAPLFDCTVDLVCLNKLNVTMTLCGDLEAIVGSLLYVC